MLVGVGWLVSWLAGWLLLVVVGWLFGWLVGCWILGWHRSCSGSGKCYNLCRTETKHFSTGWSLKIRWETEKTKSKYALDFIFTCNLRSRLLMDNSYEMASILWSVYSYLIIFLYQGCWWTTFTKWLRSSTLQQSAGPAVIFPISLEDLEVRL